VGLVSEVRSRSPVSFLRTSTSDVDVLLITHIDSHPDLGSVEGS
jgi:hypothetical protein